MIHLGTPNDLQCNPNIPRTPGWEALSQRVFKHTTTACELIYDRAQIQLT